MFGVGTLRVQKNIYENTLMYIYIYINMHVNHISLLKWIITVGEINWFIKKILRVHSFPAFCLFMKVPNNLPVQNKIVITYIQHANITNKILLQYKMKACVSMYFFRHWQILTSIISYYWGIKQLHARLQVQHKSHCVLLHFWTSWPHYNIICVHC